MPSKMMTMFKKYIITLQISNYKLKKSVFMADFLLLKNVIKSIKILSCKNIANRNYWF